MNKQKHYKIYDWMYDLGLQGLEVNVFALVYSFCTKGKEKEFNGSQQYIAQRLKMSDRQVRRIFKKLIDNKYLHKTKKKNGCIYTIGQNVLITTDIMSYNNKTIYSIESSLEAHSIEKKKGTKKFVVRNEDGTTTEVD